MVTPRDQYIVVLQVLTDQLEDPPKFLQYEKNQMQKGTNLQWRRKVNKLAFDNADTVSQLLEDYRHDPTFATPDPATIIYMHLLINERESLRKALRRHMPYVHGLAQSHAEACIIILLRLHQEIFGDDFDEDDYKQRIAKSQNWPLRERLKKIEAEES